MSEIEDIANAEFHELLEQIPVHDDVDTGHTRPQVDIIKPLAYNGLSRVQTTSFKPLQ